MTKHQYIDVDAAERLVVIPESEYLKLIAAKEDIEDIGMAVEARKRREDGTAQYLDGDLVFAMADGVTPLDGAITYRKVKLGALKEMTGLSISYISDMAKGRARGSIDAWRKLAAALDVPLDVLTEEPATS